MTIRVPCLGRAVPAADGFRIAGEAVDGASILAEVQAVRRDVVLLSVQLPDAGAGQRMNSCSWAVPHLPRTAVWER